MERLKRLREQRGLSQVKLAARADLNPATVNQIERGAREATPTTLRKLAGALGVSLVELLEDSSPKGGTTSLSPEPSFEEALEEDHHAWRLDYVAQAAKTLNTLWLENLARNEFGVQQYDEGGRGLYALDALVADAMSERYVHHPDSVPETYRAAIGNAFRAVEDLRDTLQHAHALLTARGATDLNEYRESSLVINVGDHEAARRAKVPLVSSSKSNKGAA